MLITHENLAKSESFKMADVEGSMPVLAVTAAVGAFVLLFVLLCGIGRRQNDKSENDDKGEDKKQAKKLQKQTTKKEKKPLGHRKDAKVVFNHPWLAGSLKSHSGPVLGLDFSPNGKYLASCSEDRSVLIWHVKDFAKKEHKSIRSNIELDHATRVRFSPDSKAFMVSLFNENAIRVIKIGRKDDGSIGNFQTALDFPKGHDADLINTGISSNGKFIMTCSKDTTIKLWDLKGELLSTIDTHQMNNSHGAVSPCGRFVGSSGFTPDVKVWEVIFDRSGQFKEVIRAFELKGHSAGVYSFAFSGNSDRMATVSKDGTWKLWDINVEYRKQQDPRLLKTGRCVHSGTSVIALSPDGVTIAIACNHDISVYNTVNTECEQIIEEAHILPICCLEFDTMGHYLVSAGDKNINVFHNIVGFRAHIAELEEKKRSAVGQTHRQRIQQQIQEACTKLKQLGASP
ncbi:hypothetical protein LSH36_41g13139 [Paralvinella palmiformis]|uniref:Transducin beta-like protein 2 n=1 Tax=Paralvinella palmiformis TaxID=53620 RepID=A0AAD9K7C4_9ANNE|nr:hypothetical protein LSH36_41g13139 [Paralvinella palmiformis]